MEHDRASVIDSGRPSLPTFHMVWLWPLKWAMRQGGLPVSTNISVQAFDGFRS